MSRRADNDNKPRLVGRAEAAAYLGIGVSTFSLWVATNKMPAAILGTKKWDKRAIDARLDEISGLGLSGVTEDPYEKYMREKRANQSEGAG